KRLTVSLFGSVITRKPHTLCHNIVKSRLKANRFFTDATQYGVVKGKVVMAFFEKNAGLTLQPSGLWIDETTRFLGAPPNGLITEENASIEVKALFSASHQTVNTITEVIEELTRRRNILLSSLRTDQLVLRKPLVLLSGPRTAQHNKYISSLLRGLCE
ncbi:hypothetical protein ILUMI_18689, partial [Ignelater luminosus]